MKAPRRNKRLSEEETLVAVVRATKQTKNTNAGGLSFVPSIVKRLEAKGLSREEAKNAVLAAGQLEVIELRPEGGMGRLSKAELDACPPGPEGTVLSWARYRMP
jgi:hypothetical protein